MSAPCILPGSCGKSGAGITVRHQYPPTGASLEPGNDQQEGQSVDILCDLRPRIISGLHYTV